MSAQFASVRLAASAGDADWNASFFPQERRQIYIERNLHSRAHRFIKRHYSEYHLIETILSNCLLEIKWLAQLKLLICILIIHDGGNNSENAEYEDEQTRQDNAVLATEEFYERKQRQKKKKNRGHLSTYGL